MAKIKPVENQFWIEGFYSAYDFSWDESFVFGGESHDFWEIVFVSDGMVDVAEDGTVYTLRPNDMILHAPMEFHSIRSKKGCSPKVRVLSFRTAGTLPARLCEGVFSLTEEQKNDYLRVFDDCFRFYHGEGSADCGQACSCLLQAFLCRLGSADTSEKVNSSPAAAQYRRLVAHMTARVCENLSLSELAQANNVSVSYIKLLFQKYAGISPKAYYTRLRVRYACRRLTEGGSVSEVAEEMCFSSPNYFCTFLKRTTGSLPSEIKGGEGLFMRGI